MQNPLLSVVNQCVDTITKLSREFGLTPAARSRIQTGNEMSCEQAQAHLEELLRKPKQLMTLEAIEGKVGTAQPTVSWSQNRVDATTEESKGPEEPALPEGEQKD